MQQHPGGVHCHGGRCGSWNQKPYWQWIEVAGSPAHVALGRLHAARWRAGIDAADPDLFGFEPTFCGDCTFRAPIPDVGFDGCAVGMAMADISHEGDE